MAAATAKKNSEESHVTDPVQFARNMALAAQEWQEILADFFASAAQHPEQLEDRSALQAGQTFMQAMAALLKDPQRLANLQYDLWKHYLDLWQYTSQRWMGEKSAPPMEASPKDRRFKDTAWQEDLAFDFIKQSYLLTAHWMHEAMRQAGEIDPALAKKADFYTRQFVDAMAPSNFALTNPEVLRATLESNGENLVKGLRHMHEDLRRGGGKFSIRQTDEKAFALGRNIAVTPGKVVYQNELMQLIQYAPTTKEVYRVPLLVIPAWINKFYILDLQPENSLVKWLTGQGHTVFMISWVNPDEKLKHITFEDYMTLGPLEAMKAIEKATGERETSIMAYCLGGTLTAMTLAWLAAKGMGERVTSVTYLTTLVDFAEPGELGIFIDDEQLKSLEKKMCARGFLEGEEMAGVFSMLRANDLIWTFVINNYLLGKDPMPFDLLYWNADATRLPAPMHLFYLRSMYQKNLLAKPGGITMGGAKLDLTKIKTPAYILSCREDHIAPWKSTYAATQLYSGPVTFTLAASGHIAGVVNPPAKQKYCFWSNHTRNYPASPETWFDKAEQTDGSWWGHWNEWQKKYAGDKVPARKPGGGKLKPIENAPGSYVKVR